MLLCINSSCRPEFLDIKRDLAQVVPQGYDDFLAIMSNDLMLTFSPHQLSMIGSDEYYILDGQWASLSDPVQKNAYVYGDDIYEGASSLDWNRGYEKIAYANFVLDELSNNKILSSSQKRHLEGLASYYRGLNLYYLYQVFCDYYHKENNNSLGLPLRNTANVNITFQRATLEETVNFLIKDLEKAVLLLESGNDIYLPNKQAAYGALSNVHLHLGNYSQSIKYADSCLMYQNEILNYNDIIKLSNTSFPLYGKGNKEIIFYSAGVSASILSNTMMIVNPEFYDSFLSNDLRKEIFFTFSNGYTRFKGSYSGQLGIYFTGITTTEVLLNKIESGALSNGLSESKLLLLELINKRYVVNPFDLNNMNQQQIVDLIREERKKELYFRGRRWDDLRRFTQDERYNREIIRSVNGQNYVLPSEVSKRKWLLPDDVISLGGLAQNIK